MIEIEHRRDTDLPADAVWEELRRFDRVLNWIPGGEESTITLQGEGVGAFATCGWQRRAMYGIGCWPSMTGGGRCPTN